MITKTFDPDKWQLVPKEPTSGMVAGFWGDITHGEPEMIAAKDAYYAMLAEREALIARAEAAEKDAARYRAIRYECINPDDVVAIQNACAKMMRSVEKQRGSDAFPTPEEFDAAIDSAMQQEDGE